MATKRERDVEKSYPKDDFVLKLRRLADAIEQGKRFAIQIAGERLFVPAGAVFNIEHERSGGEEEVEFQIRWRAAGPAKRAVKATATKKPRAPKAKKKR